MAVSFEEGPGGDGFKNQLMAKRIIPGSGILAGLAALTGEILHHFHSPLADFVRFLCCPFFTLLFLCLLFLTPLRRMSSYPRTRRVFLGIRLIAVLGVLALAAAIFLPRSYGSPSLPSREDIRYWSLSTGSRIAYTLVPAEGRKQPYPIIYLQGGPGGSLTEGFIRKLAPLAKEGYDIYLYDQIGSGWSDRLADIREYTADRHKHDLEAIVQQIGAKKVILLGQSWGAILATLYAADNQDRVASLIMTGPGPILPVHPELACIAAPDSLHLREPYYSNRQGNEEANNIRTRAMLWVATTFGKKLASDAEADDFAGFLNGLLNRSTVCDTSKIRDMGQPAGVGYYVQVMTVHSFRHVSDPRPKLRNTSIPLLVLKGQCDNQPWGFTREYLEVFPDHSLVVIPDAGHSISSEQQELYLSSIRNFLSRGSE